MMPVRGGREAEFARRVEELAAREPASEWVGVFRLYAAAVRGDRAGMIEMAGVKGPAAFPTVAGEAAEFDRLRGLGMAPVAAGLEVISLRSYEPLYGLMDLDRALTREVEFLRGAKREAEAAKLEGCRGRLREAYLGASRHLVERMFALNLLGRRGEAQAMADKAKGLAYLGDPRALGRVLAGMDAARAWALIVMPLLASEVAVVEKPPVLPEAKAVAAAEMTIAARSKAVQGNAAAYEGGVRVTVGALWIGCERLAVLSDASGVATLTGSGGVWVTGMANFAEGITADAFTFAAADGGAFTFTGDVRLGTKLKARACTVSAAGTVSDVRTLLQDFEVAAGVEEKVAVAARVARVYADEEIPEGARYLVAMALVRPQLTWHAGWAPPAREELRKVIDRAQRLKAEGEAGDGRWGAAHAGEAWMRGEALRQIREKEKGAAMQPVREKEKGAATRPGVDRAGDPGTYFWRLRDPGHADVARAVRLLESLLAAADAKVAGAARRWAAELRRDNTVVTMDVAGGYAKGQDAPVVLDVRCAGRVAFKLYRLRKAQDVLAVADRVGEEFVYIDYGLGAERAKLAQVHAVMERQLADRSLWKPRERMPLPAFEHADLLAQWEAEVEGLPVADVDCGWRGRWGRREWDEDREQPDGAYFGDECEAYRDRYEKTYRPGEEGDDATSAWRTDRIVKVPARVLGEPGAYVLVAEAAGQVAHAPVLVEPLSLTMRRCRDGVFLLASDGDGDKPAAGAVGRAPGTVGGVCVADAQGAAFLRTFAGGDKPILVEQGGRFAIGGFGRVFDGIYHPRWEDDFDGRLGMAQQRVDRTQAVAMDEPAAQVFADRAVIAAYTDRPTYRPGQTVQFKVIVRQLAQGPATRASGPGAFRREDFEGAAVLETPAAGTPIAYAVVNPKGRTVGQGTLSLAEFGTAAGSATLSAEEPLGAYALRVTLRGVDRLLPDVFAVKQYRRPNFEVNLAGVPAVMKEARELALDVSAAYYFGKPLAGGVAEVRLVRPAEWSAVVRLGEVALDAAGRAKVTLTLPKDLAGGEYAVIAAVTDLSGRTVSRSAPLLLDRPGPTTRAVVEGLGAVPRFVSTEDRLVVRTGAAEIAGEHVGQGGAVRVTFPVTGGRAQFRLPAEGWYALTAGNERAHVFAYAAGGGGSAEPARSARPVARDASVDESPRWVDLTDYEAEAEGLDADELPQWRRRGRVLALFDRRQAKVGETLKVLVWTEEGGRVLFTKEGRTVIDYFVAPADGAGGGYRVVEIPIVARHAPNFYLQGRALGSAGAARERPAAALRQEAMAKLEARKEDDDGEDPRWCRIDVIDPRPAAAEGLRVEVVAERANYRPGDEVSVAVKVRDAAGKGREAEVSLAAVDESVFAFGEDALADLGRLFAGGRGETRYYAKAWRSAVGDRVGRTEVARLAQAQKAMQQAMAAMEQMKQADAAQSLQRLDGARSLRAPEAPPAAYVPGERPATSIPLARLRTDFRETAAWMPQLRTGPDGAASARFTLPDSLTAYRLTAVGLTRETQVGVGRGSLRASKPLAVQVFLPRFAVESDRLQAVAVVHNGTDAARRCAVEWTVAGAKVDGVTTRPTAAVVVPARGSARTAIWLTMHEAGKVTVSALASDATDADAEERELRVEPLGREREVALNGAFEKATTLRLPEGFVARDLKISVTRGNIAAALDGLEYLVEYPNGCVEQTMSRFLPAVIVRRAIEQAPLELPAEVAARLPGVLAQGLARLYAFQRPDGGWGWFDKDKADDRMAIYVLDGLARCRAAGVAVDEGVMARGCGYVRGRLRARQLNAEQEARAMLALAVAGELATSDLAAVTQRADAGRAAPIVRCTLAVAARAAGCVEQGRQIWADVRGWSATSTQELAMKLNGQMAYGEPLADCYATAGMLLDRRQGQRWGNTQETAAAIEALASMLRYVRGSADARGVSFAVGGKPVLKLAAPADLARLVYRTTVRADQLPSRDALPIELAVDCDQPVRYAITAVGRQRLDKMEETGAQLRLRRQFLTLDGKPLAGAVAVGQVIAVRLTLQSDADREYVHLEDRRPAGFEVADEQWVPAAPGAATPAAVEYRDDRIAVFFRQVGAGRHEYTYYLRAETPSASHALPALVYQMYDERVRADSAAHKLEVK